MIYSKKDIFLKISKRTSASVLKTKMKMKKRSRIYDINIPRSRHGQVSEYDGTYMY